MTALRRRRSPVSPSQPQLPSSLSPTPVRTWRFYVRWAARLALPLVYLLANARFVAIPPPPPLPPPLTSAVLLFTHSRPDYLNRSLASLLQHHPGGPGWPIHVSQDRQDGLVHEDVAAVVRDAQKMAQRRGIVMQTWAHEMSYEEEGDQGGDNSAPFADAGAYRRIARHYRWGLGTVFQEEGVRRVVVMEDDMEVAPDFYGYFAALAPVLDADETLWCVSAWNDNGVEGLSGREEALHRTDFFPGLGWMMRREVWEELRPKWPAAYWDDWMRSREVTRGRQCVRPEVSRTRNFGARGVSQSFYYERHVSKVVLARGEVEWGGMDLGYLRAEVYRDYVFSRMRTAVQLRFSNYLTTRPQEEDVIAFYPENLDAIAKRTGIMKDHREGVKRTGYEGVVFFPWNGHWAFVAQRGWEPPEGYRLEGRMCC